MQASDEPCFESEADKKQIKMDPGFRRDDEQRGAVSVVVPGNGRRFLPPASRLPPLPLLPKTENRKPKTENQTQSTYASRFLPRITRCFSIFQSRSFRVARLSCSCLPLASASSSLTLLAFQYIAVGTRV
jgi:hypothetical protein